MRIRCLLVQPAAAPFLDGRLVAVHDPTYCALSHVESIRSVDAYLECPFIHLRYYLEEWTDRLMAWIKFFFIPSLHYHRYDDLPGYDALEGTFVDVLARAGIEGAG